MRFLIGMITGALLALPAAALAHNDSPAWQYVGTVPDLTGHVALLHHDCYETRLPGRIVITACLAPTWVRVATLPTWHAAP